MEITTSRRALLGAFAATPAVAITAAHGAQPSRVRWNAALSRVLRADVEHDRACTTLSEAQEGYYAERPDDEIDGRFFVNDTVEIFNARIAAQREQRDQADQAARARHGVEAAERAEGRAADELDTAIEAMIATPAPDTSALVRKLELAREFELETAVMEHALADLRRLAGAEL